MKLLIINDNELRIEYNSKVTSFSIEKNQTDLTDFVKEVSDADAEISIEPICHEDLLAQYDKISVELKKLTAYIYKIVEAFNTSYAEVYPTDF